MNSIIYLFLRTRSHKKKGSSKKRNNSWKPDLLVNEDLSIHSFNEQLSQISDLPNSEQETTVGFSSSHEATTGFPNATQKLPLPSFHPSVDLASAKCDWREIKPFNSEDVFETDTERDQDRCPIEMALEMVAKARNFVELFHQSGVR